MKYFIFSLISLLCASLSYANVYHSIDAEIESRLVILPTEHPDRFLIGFDGFQHELDRQAMLYEKRLNSRDARDGHYYQMLGMPYTHVRNNGRTTLIFGTSVPYLEVHLAGRAPVKMVLTGPSDTAMKERIEQRYSKRQGYSLSRIEARKQVEQAAAQLHSDCAATIQVQVDWDSFAGSEHRTTPAVGARYIEALNQICQRDDDYRQAVLDISEVTLVLAESPEQHQIKRNGSQIVVGLASAAPNITETSYAQLVALF
ncbi:MULTISPECIES: hypothetical protein [Alkalimonas]|uniref:Uncharacterized protein n=1 Tax=Alkalimonas mucilaginosa TaxID=3057676 RepID=A0ABU7JJJ2_9GAMM|nr:hypothetical protein [Alkalimonas sp. MEB004]MEE2025503.1 hypothetical protein [Alkalimonas sp. MEB004]